MKKMKLFMGVLACFLFTLSFGVTKVHAADYTNNPSEFFSSLQAIEDGETAGLDVLSGMNAGEDGTGSNPTSCITLPAEFCIGTTVHLKGAIASGVKVTYNGTDYTDSLDITLTIETSTTVNFTATNASGETYDFSVTLSENKACPEEKTYCEADPSKDSEIEACISGGKTEAECIEEKCPKTYCELDPSKDEEIKKCIEGGKTEDACVKEICTYCKEDPSKDKDVKKCIEDGGKETDCIQKICVKENPKTGITSPMIGIAGLLTLVIANVLIFRKREN